VPDDTPFCFKWPDAEVPADTPAQLIENLTWLPESRQRATAIMRDFADREALKTGLLANLDDEGLLAAARILAILVCAEESAISIFHHECTRLEEAHIQANITALREIETEERVHNWLIHRARAFYPVPDDILALRRRTRRLFMRVASRDLGEHFARISGLDSGVCICLTALLGTETVTSVPAFARLIRHIRRDESSHVKKSRTHAVYLGFDHADFGAAYELTRGSLVKMLEPVAHDFEVMGVDSDRLIKRLLYHNHSRNTAEDLDNRSVPVT